MTVSGKCAIADVISSTAYDSLIASSSNLRLEQQDSPLLGTNFAGGPIHIKSLVHDFS